MCHSQSKNRCNHNYRRNYDRYLVGGTLVGGRTAATEGDLFSGTLEDAETEGTEGAAPGAGGFTAGTGGGEPAEGAEEGGGAKEGGGGETAGTEGEDS